MEDMEVDTVEEERNIFYRDARDGLLTSAADKQRKALKHFNYFLKGYCTQIGIEAVEAENIPYSGIPRGTSYKSISEWWDSCIGAFVTYMGSHAKSGCNPKGQHLSRTTADGYCSSVKVYFTNKFRTESEIPVFQKTQWGKLREKLKGLYRESNRSKGKPTETEDVSSTTQDRKAMATACIWIGSPEFAEFWHLQNTTYHCSGRGSEVSLIKSEDITTTEKNELVYRYDILEVQLQRQKSGPLQTLPIYPHRDGILEDFYFSLIHLIVVKGCSHEYVLPVFSKAALKTKESGESNSGVSKEWTKFFGEIRNTFEILADEINEELGSHSNRRGSNQAMVESPSLGGYAPILRSGLKSKSIHTIFDYIFGSTELLHQAGKTLSRWTTKIGESTVGGQPPTFYDINTDVDALKKFTNVIFENDTDKRWHPKVRELLVMTLLLRYDQFVDVLQSHPFTKLVETHPDAEPMFVEDRYTCSSVRDNIFINRINQALEKACGGNDLMFTKWVCEARKAFLSRNAPGLPIEAFPLYGGSADGRGILMDTRCFTDHFNALASVAHANHMELQQHRHTLNDIRNAFNVESKITSSFIVEKLFNMEKSIRRLENHLIGETPTPVTPPRSKGVIRFSVSSKSLPKYASLSEVTTAFFVDDFCAGRELDLKSPSWAELDSQQKKSLRNKFTSIKRAVRMILGYADSFPLMPNNPSQYKNIVREIATAAEKRIRDALGFDDDTIISMYKLEKQLKLPAMKEVEKSLSLPDNTPGDMRKFFR
jgi:hypothetical protein